MNRDVNRDGMNRDGMNRDGMNRNMSLPTPLWTLPVSFERSPSMNNGGGGFARAE